MSLKKKMLRIVRYSSSIAKVWVKHNGDLAVKVPTVDCKDISDLAKAIKEKLSPELSLFSVAQLTFHSTLTDAALEPDFLISSISEAGLSAKSPLFVKVPEKKSTVALVLHSNITIEEKESLLEDFLQAKDREALRD